MFTINKGAILEFQRVYGITHFAIAAETLEFSTLEYLLPNSRRILVVHVAPVASKLDGQVNIVEEYEFITGTTYVRNHFDDVWAHYTPEEVVERARSKKGSWKYCIFNNNCEHFANWCRYDREVSMQSVGGIETEDVSVGKIVPAVTLGSARVSFLSGRVGKSSGNKKGAILEGTVAEANYGPAHAQVGLGVSSTVQCSDGTIGAQLLGTGVHLGRETSISFFGNKIGFKF